MKQCIYVGLILLITIYSYKQAKKYEDKDKEKMSLSFQIVPENYERDWYYIKWEDTLGKSKGYTIINRPKEIWCVITNKANDTLGYYKGLSTAQNFAYFQTKDSIITINFMIGINLFPQAFQKERKEQYFNDKDTLPIIFKPIEVNIKNNLIKKIQIEIEEK